MHEPRKKLGTGIKVIGALLIFVIVFVAFFHDEFKGFQQRKNVNLLHASDSQSQGVLPHRVNSMGKLAAVWRDGFRGFEVDVHFQQLPAQRFLVGHDAEDLHSMTLSALIQRVPHTEIKRIWLDIKNLSLENYLDVLGVLEKLDRAFSIKAKVLLESRWTHTKFKVFAEKGWQTSFYLPTERLATLLEQENGVALQGLAQKIRSQSARQQLAALSFDSRVYPFVEKYMAPILQTRMVYHIWDLSLKLHHNKVVSRLYQQDYFFDPRVKTVLLPYYFED